ncbi:hypothetical protein DCE93_01215 [Agromyces badenianii]|uniref:Transposase n=2 Tax=Agromyces badenianii TaxID=2080742 RepID=A0A2S0WT05_9MICO|nr:hypothetical protein DCE93_01215 [Agromyces badenianii]
MKEIELPLELIRSSQVLDYLVEWRAEEPPKYRGGAKSTITDLHVLVAATVLALEHSSLHLKRMRDVLAYRLDDEAREYLGVPPQPDDKHDPVAAKNWKNNTEYAAKKLIKIMDPYADLDRRRPTTRDQRTEFRARLDHDPRRRNLERRKKEHLDQFSNAFLEATYQTMNRDTRRALTKSGLTADQTPMPTAGRIGRSRLVDGAERKNPKVLEPEMNWYYKRPDDREQRPGEGGGPGKDTSSSVWGAAANFAILTAEIKGVPVPPIAIGFSLSTPLVDSEGELVKLAKSVVDRGHKPAHITADREFFAGKDIEKLHKPVRELGFDVVTDYKRDMLGVKGGHAGAVQIEGRHYCPGMGPDLMNASVDAESGLLDEDTYIQRIEKRRAFELRAKERPDENGKQPMMCPAHGPQARVVCPLRERHPKSSSKPKAKVLPANVPVAIDGQLPAVCSQTSVTFTGDEGLKHKQVLRYGSEEWAETYNRDRNLSEGFNSYIKDPSHEAFEARGGRRMRGLAAQQFLATFLVVSANLRAIYTFVHDRYLAEAYGVTKNRAVHISDYARNWFTKPATDAAGPPAQHPLRT